MAIREIVTLGHPTLREKSRRVVEFGPGLKTLVDDMIETMHDARGVGLAAPQIDVKDRVVVVELPADEDEGTEAELYVFVNPEIVKTSRETESDQEGCLSVPGYLGEVERHQMIVVRGLDTEGMPQRLRAHGYLARIFQHEIDHLNGVLFIDHISDPSKIRKVTEEDREHLSGEAAEALALYQGQPVKQD